MKVLVLNGPNLGRLGRRQPEIYGATTYDELADAVRRLGPRPRARGRGPPDQPRGRAARLAQHRRRRADPGRAQRRRLDPLLLALDDACAQLTAPLVEVHLSDPAQRPEEFRHHSVVTPYATAVIAGQGVDGYHQALAALR